MTYHAAYVFDTSAAKSGASVSQQPESNRQHKATMAAAGGEHDAFQQHRPFLNHDDQLGDDRSAATLVDAGVRTRRMW